jgi:hypothetical protein
VAAAQCGRDRVVGGAKGITTGKAVAQFAEVLEVFVRRHSLMTAWRNRPLERVHPVVFIERVFMDAIHAMVRDGQPRRVRLRSLTASKGKVSGAALCPGLNEGQSQRSLALVQPPSTEARRYWDESSRELRPAYTARGRGKGTLRLMPWQMSPAVTSDSRATGEACGHIRQSQLSGHRSLWKTASTPNELFDSCC